MKLSGAAIALALLAIVVLASCKKYYTCACTTITTGTTTDTTGGFGFTNFTDTSSSTETYNTTKNDAKDRCADVTESHITTLGINISVAKDCELR